MANVTRRIKVINSDALAIASLLKHLLVAGSFGKAPLSSRPEEGCELMSSAALARCLPRSEFRYRNHYLQPLSGLRSYKTFNKGLLCKSA